MKEKIDILEFYSKTPITATHVNEIGREYEIIRVERHRIIFKEKGQPMSHPDPSKDYYEEETTSEEKMMTIRHLEGQLEALKKREAELLKSLTWAVKMANDEYFWGNYEEGKETGDYLELKKAKAALNNERKEGA